MGVTLHMYDGLLALVLILSFWVTVRMTLEFFRLCRWIAPHLAHHAPRTATSRHP